MCLLRRKLLRLQPHLIRQIVEEQGPVVQQSRHQSHSPLQAPPPQPCRMLQPRPWRLPQLLRQRLSSMAGMHLVLSQ